MQKVWERIDQIASSQQLDQQKVWERIGRIGSSVYIHEDRIREIQMQSEEFQKRTDQINEELERLAQATTKAVKTVTELAELVKSYLRGLKNGGSTS